MDLVLTLAIFVGVFLTFLIAPLVALGLAYLGYAVLRPRGRRSGSAGPRQQHQAAHGFGAGTA